LRTSGAGRAGRTLLTVVIRAGLSRPERECRENRERQRDRPPSDQIASRHVPSPRLIDGDHDFDRDRDRDRDRGIDRDRDRGRGLREEVGGD
jgi:hypothetical protein